MMSRSHRLPRSRRSHRLLARLLFLALFALIAGISTRSELFAGPTTKPAAAPKAAHPAAHKGAEKATGSKENAAEEITPERIDEAIKKGVAYIYSQQKPQGRWETSDHRTGTSHKGDEGDTFGGYSALATYALLAAGEKPDDKRIVSAIGFLEKADIVGIYGLGIRAQIWHLLARNPKNKAEMQQLATADADRLIAGINTEGDNRGLWDYIGKGTRVDHSVSQYGILGLWALQQAGAKIDIRYWRTFDQVWRADQFPDGGWAYDSTPKHTGVRKPAASMTAAGIATLFITQDNTYTDLPDRHGNVSNNNIINGLTWMTAHFNEVTTNYAWYGVGRIGAASGTKYFGTIDWFERGATSLLKTQKPDGSWLLAPGPYGETLSATCFAVLFLSRGRAPIMLNKLQYEMAAKTPKAQEANWNERPRDAANLAQWTGDQFEGTVNWQLVNLKVAPEELRDAPILYLAGDQALSFTDEEESKLKTFVHEGGMILANADFSSKAFSDSVMKLGTKLFGYEFRELPPSSPIWNENARIPREGSKLLAMSNGIREIMILFNTGDPARAWQTPASLTAAAAPKSLEIGANIFLYAVDHNNLTSRGNSTLVLSKRGIKTDASIAIARLQYGGNWDPEPGGWQRLAAIFHNELHTELEVKTVALGHGELGRFKIAHMTGTSKFQLTDEQLDELHKFIGAGGTLLMDSGGGSADFSSSADQMLRKLFPEDAAKALNTPLSPEDPFYTLAAHKIDRVEYRRFAKTVVGSLHTGRVYGIPVKNRTAVYYSPEDISGGLVGQPTDGINGYTPECATEIARNIILRSAQHGASEKVAAE